MRRMLIISAVMLFMLSSVLVFSHPANYVIHPSSMDEKNPENSTRSTYPLWSIGDSYNYTQTHYDTSLYSSYSYRGSYEVMNRTTVTTPEGTYDVYGVRGKSHGAWTGIWPVSDGYFYYNSTSYYNASDKALVETRSESTGANYHLNGYTYYKPPTDHWDHPVEDNESWSVTSTYYYRNSGVIGGEPHYSEGEYSYTANYTCLGRGSTAVGAGTFSTLKIRSRSGPSSYSITYLDGEMGWYVKSETYVNGTLNTVYELNSTTFKHAPKVDPDSFDLTMLEDAVDDTSVDLTEIFTSPEPLNYSVESTYVMNVTISKEGNVTFRPGRNWHGSTTVTFRADDGKKNSTKDITITVIPVNDAPYFVSLPDIAIPEGGSDSTLDLDDHVRDVDNEMEELTLYVEPGEHVEATLLSGNIVRFRSPGNWYGEDLVKIRAKDPDLYSTTETITVIVSKLNDPPAISPLSDLTVPQYGYLNLTIEATDPDFEETVMFRTNISEAVEGISEGAEYSMDPVTGEFAFHPVAEKLVGSHPLSFWADDGTARDHANITLTVENVNDPPVAEGSFSHMIIHKGEDTPGNANITVRFTSPSVSDQDGDEIEYIWDPGDGSDRAYGPSVDHTYSRSGNYTVTLEISDGIMKEPLIQTAIVSLPPPNDAGKDGGDDDDGGDGYGDDSEDSEDSEVDDNALPGDDGREVEDDPEPHPGAGENGNGGEELSDTGESGISGSSVWLIVVIVFIVLLGTAFFIALAVRIAGENGSEDQDEPIRRTASPGYQQPVPSAPEAERLITTEPGGPAPSTERMCPGCGLEARYYPELQCYWCERCGSYVYREHRTNSLDVGVPADRSP